MSPSKHLGAWVFSEESSGDSRYYCSFEMFEHLHLQKIEGVREVRGVLEGEERGIEVLQEKF